MVDFKANGGGGRAHGALRLFTKGVATGLARGLAIGFALTTACSPGAHSGQGASGDDATACKEICAASEKCSDRDDDCVSSCNTTIASRAREGEPGAIAECAVPRIEHACDKGRGAKGVSKALVRCIDAAGREVLTKDEHPMKVAARALCRHQARCTGAETSTVKACVGVMIEKSKSVEGLGLFGVVRPELVDEFATCVEGSTCGDGSETTPCFSGLLGVTSGSGGGGDDDEEAPAPPPQRPPPSTPHPPPPHPTGKPPSDGTTI